MGRKKKIVEEPQYEYSKYQKAIFEYIEKGNGNLVVNASAGSGKSFTLVHALKLIPEDKHVLFSAFNKDIVKALEKKIEKKDNIHISTIHSLGLSIIKSNLGEAVSPIPNPNKYRSHIFNNINEYTSMNLNYMSKVNYLNYINNINRLVDLLRVNLVDNSKDALEVVEHYDIPIIGDEIEVALQVIEWGKEATDSIDYTDMIYLPIVLYLKPYKSFFDYIFVDECQDLNKAQRELLFKCSKMGTRYIFVGDANQSIYGFNGSDTKSFEYLKNLPNTISLPLSISYRCPRKVVQFAQNIVPEIEYKEDAIDGEIIYNAKLEDIIDGDMIICRNNAPLMKIYADLLKLNKKCFIRGKDIGSNLISFIKSTNKDELNIDLNKDGVFVRLYNHLFEVRNKVMQEFSISKKDALETTICSEMLDKIRALEILSEGLINTEELIDRIKEIFSDKEKEGIALSTIHKAKGLEANNVYIAMRSLMPSKSAKKDWQKLQEKNLIYVAYTRSKNKLGFLSEEDFKSFNGDGINSTLDNIERRVNILLNKNVSTGITFNRTNLDRIIQRTSKIRENNNKTINLNNNTQIKQPLSLGRKKISQIKKNIYL